MIIGNEITASVLAALVGTPLLILSILSQVELWQRKEYRLDRMRAHLLSSEDYHLVWSWPTLALGAVGLAIFLEGLQQAIAAEIMAWLAVVLLLAHHGWRISQRGIFRPEFTTKAIIILSGVFVVMLIYLPTAILLLKTSALPLSTALLLVVIITPAVVGLVNVLAWWRKQQIIRSATALRQQLSRLTTIGITGSYGKTSTKHFLGQILQKSFPATASTLEHHNSAIGVAQDMLKQLTPKLAIYVAEMGAYRAGEIRALARLVRPQIGVITGISNQHLALFGSREKILAAKWELIEALPPDGIAVLNADSPLLQARAKTFSGRIIWYSLLKPAQVQADQIIFADRQTTCQLHINQQTQVVTLPLISQGLLASAMAAAATALAVGLQPAEIFKQLTTLTPFARTMEVVTGQKNATIIDDSYSANEIGVIEGLKSLNRFKQPDKRVVLVPLIELGSDATAAHQRLGQALAQTPAQIYFYGKKHHAVISKAYQQAGGQKEQLFFIDHPRHLLAALQTNLSAQTVVLLKGRVPDVVRKTLRS